MVSIRAAVPGAVLLPARELLWEQKTSVVTIELPIKGKISELLLEHPLEADTKIPGEDVFCLLEDDCFQFIELVRVLFATARYPDLQDHQCFLLFGVEKVDDNLLKIHGQVLEIVGQSNN